MDYSSDNGTTFIIYYYLRNAQNDVVKLIDGTGTSVVQYTYDTWGAQTSCTGTLATTLGQNQPFRYRGYVYDTETGWYYLQSRYYDPSIGRFISSDVLLSTGQGVLGHNAYAYCGNNAVARSDSEGTLWNIIVGAIVGAIVAAATQVVVNIVTGNEWSDGVLGAAVGGAVSGAVLAATGSTFAASYAGAAAESLTNEVVSYCTGEKELTADNILGSSRKVIQDTLVYGTVNAVFDEAIPNLTKRIQIPNRTLKCVTDTICDFCIRNVCKFGEDG